MKRPLLLLICVIVLAILAALIFQRSTQPAAGDLPAGHDPRSSAGAGGASDAGAGSRGETKRPRPDADLSPRAQTEKKLKRIKIPTIAFENTTVEEAIEFLRLRAAELDDEKPRGTGFFSPDAATDSPLKAIPDPGALPLLSLQARDASLWETLVMICRQANLHLMIAEDGTVELKPR